ncbi:MAG: 16S rRNA (guanine(527)-N(7))-methyltransferase RsmG [Candidatus Hydrothermales bacterium]
MENYYELLKNKEINEKIEKFVKILKEVNKRINLISKKDLENIYKKHITESLFFLDIIKGKKIVDIGSGAGFPGIILAIIKKDYDFYLIERNKKKAEFLRKIKRELNLKNVRIYDCDLKDFNEKNKFEFVSRGAGYEKILKILKEKKFKGYFYPVLPNEEEKYKYITFINKWTNKKIKIGTIEIQ